MPALTPLGTRRGPRPLPLHLATYWMVTMSSLAALPLARLGSLAWSRDLAAVGESLRPALAAADPEALAGALAAEVRRRQGAMLAGIEAYRNHPYVRRVAAPDPVWSDGTTLLRDYGPEGGAPVLVVPSLINRAYIVDLTEDRSLLRWLGVQGLRPFLVDWDAPGEAERDFTLTDYVVGRLEGALDAVRRISGRAPAVVGYCMGGLLALALVQRRAADVAGLALLATPWDFHAGAPDHTRLFGALPLATLIRLAHGLPVDMLQSLLASLDPNLVPNKLRAFARLDPASPEAHAFVALEDWLNDGVDLVGSVAEECLIGWYAENRPERGRWRIAGTPVRPDRYAGPTLIVVPARDRIVPPPSAEALAQRMPHASVHRPHAGHIGMMIGRNAEAALWRPLAGWLAAL